MIAIGIDPGLTGALAVVCSRRGLLDVADVPVCGNGIKTGKMLNWVDVPELWTNIATWSLRFGFAGEDVQVAIERPIPMPDMPAQTIASTFDTFGAIRSVMLARGYQTTAVPPVEWKRQYGLKSKKDDSIACCQRIHPTPLVKLKKHHNRAEAVLIGDWLIRQVVG